MSDPNEMNVLMIVTDDQRFDTINALGPGAVTPNLDRLVEGGCAFTRAHNMGSTHVSVCVPARSMIHSGRSLFHLDGPGGMTTEHPTLPESFGDAGYRTFATGKWHNGTEAFNRCYEEGENIFFGGMDSHWNVPVTDRHPTGEYPPDRAHTFRPGGSWVIQSRQRTYDRYSSGTHSTDLFADTTAQFLREHDRSEDDRPFFSYTAFMAPHDPRVAPGEYHAMYDPQDIELPPNFAEKHAFDNGHLYTRDEDLAGHPRDAEEVRCHIADYRAMVTHIDAAVGRILDTLEQTGQRENTLVVFTADHGLAVGRHGLMGKHNVYEHSVRVPLIFNGPGIPENERRDAFSYHHDLYPTLADLAGLTTPDTVDGESLVSVIAQNADGPRESVFTGYSDTQRAVRTDQYKLIENFRDSERRTQLFEVSTDSAETEDLSEDPAHADALEDLRERLEEWRDTVDDPTLRS